MVVLLLLGLLVLPVFRSHDNAHLAPDVYHPGRCAICSNMCRQFMTTIAGTPSLGSCHKAPGSMRRAPVASEARSQSQPRP